MMYAFTLIILSALAHYKVTGSVQEASMAFSTVCLIVGVSAFVITLRFERLRDYIGSQVWKKQSYSLAVIYFGIVSGLTALGFYLLGQGVSLVITIPIFLVTLFILAWGEL